MNSQDEATGATPEIEIDLDEVLDMDGDVERRKFLQGLLTGAKQPQDIINVSSHNALYYLALACKTCQSGCGDCVFKEFFISLFTEIHRRCYRESEDAIILHIM